MQPSELAEHISSDFVEAFNALQPKSSPIRVFVYVESYEDISFWRDILNQYQTGEIQFEIDTATHKGKIGALERNNDLLLMKVGEYLIACIDSDYDYLLPERNSEAKLINQSPHIFQTYSYSIENLKCVSSSLHSVCVRATMNDKRVFNFDSFFKTFSKIIFPLFLWNLFFRKQNDNTTFPISSFCEIVKLTDKINIADQCSNAIEVLKTRVDNKIQLLEGNHPMVVEEIKKMATSMIAMGVNEENTYLFIQGHTLKDNVVLMVLKPWCQLLVSEKFQQIKDNAQHKIQEENDRNHYKNQKQEVVSVLNLNTDFKNCFLYQKIKTDLDRYVATLSHSI